MHAPGTRRTSSHVGRKEFRGQKAEGVPHFMLEMPGNIFLGRLCHQMISKDQDTYLIWSQDVRIDCLQS